MQVAEQDFAHFGDRRLRQQFSGGEVMRDLAEDPWPALRSAADHHCVGPGVIQHEFRALRRIDIAVCDHRNAYRCLHRGNRVVFGQAGVLLIAGAAVHRERCDAATFCDARDAQRVAMFAIPASADLQRDRNTRIDRIHHRRQDARDQRLIAQQRRASPGVADFLRWATHVDIDDLRALLDVVTRGIGEHIGNRAGDLHADRRRFAGMVHPVQRLARAPETRVGTGHLRHAQPGAESLAQYAERFIGNAGHRRQDHVGFNAVRADQHRHSVRAAGHDHDPQHG